MIEHLENSSQTLDKEAKRKFATHSDLSVEIKDNIDRLELLRDISILIRYMIDTFGNAKPFVYQKFVPKSPIETSTCHSV